MLKQKNAVDSIQNRLGEQAQSKLQKCLETKKLLSKEDQALTNEEKIKLENLQKDSSN